MGAEHIGWLAPVKRDLDGQLMVLCGVDGITGAGFWADGVALWCPDCRSLVTDVLPGSEGVDLDTSSGEAVLVQEEHLAAEHQAAMPTVYPASVAATH